MNLRTPALAIVAILGMLGAAYGQSDRPTYVGRPVTVDCAPILNPYSNPNLPLQTRLKAMDDFQACSQHNQELIEQWGEQQRAAKAEADKAAADANNLKQWQWEQQRKKQAAAAKASCERKGGVSIGMTADQVLASCWGRPQHRNVTYSTKGSLEQWVYGIGSYVYLEDGIVTSIQAVQR